MRCWCCCHVNPMQEAPQTKSDSPPLYWSREYLSVIWRKTLKSEPCPHPLESTLQPSLSLFCQHPQSSHVQGGSSAFVELNFLVDFFTFFFPFFFSRSGNGLAVFWRIELWVFPHNCAKHSHMQLCISPSLIFSMWEWHEVNMFRGYLCVSSTLRCPLAFWAPPSPTCSMVRVFMRA